MTQPAPKPGKDKVADRALLEFVRVHQEQVAKGAAEHGGPLQTFNGRSALTDAQEELCDAWQYLEQAKMEQVEIREKAEKLIKAVFRYDDSSNPVPWVCVIRAAKELCEALDGQGSGQ
jgi:hypothetical protein